MKTTCRVMIARFPGNHQEHPESVDWCIQTYHKAKMDPRISEVLMWKKADTPITMSRNKCLEDAIKMNIDYVVMIDSDMGPDQQVLGAVPFWETAFDWIFNREAPSVIAAPYCGGESIHHNIFVFQWENFTNAGFPSRSADFKLSQFTRREAAERGGIEQVAALPTGLMIIDMRVLERLTKPYFYYGFDGDGKECVECHRQLPGPEAVKNLTEDVAFTRDIALAWHDVPGAGCFCAWDSWAYHIKLCHIGKPFVMTNDMAGARFKDALASPVKQGEQIRNVNLSFPKVNPQTPDEEVDLDTYSYFMPNGQREQVDAQTFTEMIQTEFADVVHG